ncbi:hypothetical protein V6N13_025665 [Hibiscus sabdariffa]|uniref:Uncharacterized protein n=2 Tax=Hibiscus sabdariffa TaxID=183260 RepID=A0ABR2C9R8_9ROSI
MSGSSNRRQPTSSPLASQSVFGQANPSSNPFAPNSSFGCPTPFGSQTGGAMFGGTSTGVFGAAQPSPFSSITTFGASSTPAFGSSIPAFGSSSSFGIGGSSGFVQNPAFGFGLFPLHQVLLEAQHSNNSLHLVVMYLVPTQPLVQLSMYSVPQAPLPSVPRPPSIPAFGSTGSPAFGSIGTAFGTGGTFGASSRPAFGTPSIPFGASTTSAFGTSATTAFGASSTPSFNFGSTPTFGQSTPAFGGQSLSPAFGSTTFGQSAFGGRRGGSRATPYTPTTDADSPDAKFESISAIPVYKDKSQEELRWEDYQSGDKGGSRLSSQPSGRIGFGMSAVPANPLGGSSSTLGQTSVFSSASAIPFSLKLPSFNSTSFTTSTTTSNPFQSTSSSLFGPTSSTTPSLFTSTTAKFGTGSSPFSSSVTPFSSSPSIFSSGAAQVTTPAIGQGTSTFGQNTSNVGLTNIFNPPSSGFGGNVFSCPPSTPSSNPVAFGSTTFLILDFVSLTLHPLLLGRSVTQSAAVVQPVTLRTLLAIPQMSSGRAGMALSVQYGISNMHMTF